MDTMMIKTNLSPTSPVHNVLAYKPIEVQVMDLLLAHFNTVKYELLVKQYIFTIDDYQVTLETTRKTVLISTYYPKIRFDGLPHPSVRLPYNQDVGDKVAQFAKKVRKVQEIEKKAAALTPLPDERKIDDFLNKELGTKCVIVRYWHQTDNFFNGQAITFYLHPRYQVPADGVFMCLELDGSIKPWCKYGGNSKIEDAVGKRQGNDIASMERRIEEIKELQARIAQFDYKKSPELVKLLGLKRQATELRDEFAKIG